MIPKKIFFYFLIFSFFIPSAAQASDFTVNVFDDPTPVAAPNGCSSGGRCSLREAILSSNATSGPNNIHLSAGHYVLTLVGNTGPNDGDLNIDTNSATIMGQGADVTSVDGSAIDNPVFTLFNAGTGLVFTFQGLTIKGGHNALQIGGGISLQSSSADTLNIESCVFSGNSSDQGGGALGATGIAATTINVLNSTFVDNHALNGGVGGAIGISGPTLNLNNSTLSANDANFGGGIVVDSSSATVTLNVRSSTIFNNQATTSGGGVAFFGSGSVFTVQNTILSGNTDSAGAESDCEPRIVSGTPTFTGLGFNVFGFTSGDPCGAVGGLITPDDQTGIANPGLLPLANNGGPTPTHFFDAASPVFDKGSPGSCNDTSGAPLTTDQRGQTRPAGARCDVGAVELGTSDLRVTKISDAPTYEIGETITFTLTLSNQGPGNNFQVHLIDPMPAGVDFVSASLSSGGGTCTETPANTLDCVVDELDSGSSLMITVTGTAVQSGDFTNSAAANGTEIDPDPNNNTGSTTFQILSGGLIVNGGGCQFSPGSESRASYVALGLLLGGLDLFRRREKMKKQS